MKKIVVALSAAALLTACSTYTTPRYSINADTNVTLKSLGVSNVAIGRFHWPNDI